MGRKKIDNYFDTVFEKLVKSKQVILLFINLPRITEKELAIIMLKTIDFNSINNKKEKS